MTVIEPEHIDELVKATRQGALVWRLAEGGDAVAEDAVYHYHLDAGGTTLFRIGKNPFYRETGSVARSDELSVARILTPMVNSPVLPVVAPPSPSSSRAKKRSSRSRKGQRRPRLKEAMPTIREAAKHSRVGDEQMVLIERTSRRGDPAYIAGT